MLIAVVFKLGSHTTQDTRDTRAQKDGLLSHDSWPLNKRLLKLVQAYLQHNCPILLHSDWPLASVCGDRAIIWPSLQVSATGPCELIAPEIVHVGWMIDLCIIMEEALAMVY